MSGVSSSKARPSASTEVDGAARRSFALGQAAWPQLVLEYETYCAYFLMHAKAAVPPETHARDMFLACACAQGNADALRVFEDTLVIHMARAVASIDSSGAFVEEVLQVTRERLFLARGQEPGKIAAYAGRASLKAWLCAVVARMAISVHRTARRRRLPTTFEGDQRLADGGPEFEFLRGRYKGVFEDALRMAMQRLPRKQRMLLRLHWSERMSIDKLAKVYSVGRSTAARWLASAHELLLEQVRRELHEKVRLTSTELDNLTADVRSQLDVSLRWLLSSSQGSR